MSDDEKNSVYSMQVESGVESMRQQIIKSTSSTVLVLARLFSEECLNFHGQNKISAQRFRFKPSYRRVLDAVLAVTID